MEGKLRAQKTGELYETWPANRNRTDLEILNETSGAIRRPLHFP
jgi:hypothetical protein